MSKPIVDMSTDSAWEEWGRRDPYFGVITHPKFRRSAMNEDAKREFFESGAPHAQHVLATIRRHINPEFAPRKVLDFGCGVGRLLVPFAGIVEEVVGLDISSSMLEEARRNCDERQLRNVRLLHSDDDLSILTDRFDLIHSFIVFQHIPVERGRTIISKLLRHLNPGGIAAIHLTYSKTRFAATHGVAPPGSPPRRAAASATPGGADPEIQMNPYNLNEILFLMQCQGVQQCHIQFSDHGGELGVFLFFCATGSRIVAV
jgi:SAM-dependent methyltransferase